jgi:uncharacterized protein YndB with AHSA1/START domain
MAENEVDVKAAPEAVWAVLSDPYAYEAWVVGAKDIRGADEGFPAEGTRLYHRVGVGPLTLSDSTLVVRAEAPRLLALEARLGPFGSARVELQLQEHGTGTRIHMHESGSRGPSRILQPAGDLLLRGRNLWSLERLKELAERRA